ncbi:MAG: hypothetical protein NVSMB53_16090 [Gemmatimonadaceae bacterium]
MKVPGRAWLQFEVTRHDTRSEIRQTAIFEPRGVAGLLYWYALYPVHRLIFNGLLRGIAAHASQWCELTPIRRLANGNLLHATEHHAQALGALLRHMTKLATMMESELAEGIPSKKMRTSSGLSRLPDRHLTKRVCRYSLGFTCYACFGRK